MLSASNHTTKNKVSKVKILFNVSKTHTFDQLQNIKTTLTKTENFFCFRLITSQGQGARKLLSL